MGRWLRDRLRKPPWGWSRSGSASATLCAPVLSSGDLPPGHSSSAVLTTFPRFSRYARLPRDAPRGHGGAFRPSASGSWPRRSKRDASRSARSRKHPPQLDVPEQLASSRAPLIGMVSTSCRYAVPGPHRFAPLFPAQTQRKGHSRIRASSGEPSWLGAVRGLPCYS